MAPSPNPMSLAQRAILITGAGRGIGQINYGVAKSGLLGMTMSAAREWAHFNIRVNGGYHIGM